MAAGNVLVMDADPEVRDGVRRVLERDGRALAAASDGPEALECARREPVDLVVAGQGRNGFGGFELLRRIRAEQPASKVILLGDADPGKALQAIREKAFSYFHKPIPQGPLADMARLALESDAWRADIRLISAIPEWISLEVRSKFDAAERAAQFVREIEADLSRRACEDVACAFRELLLNAMEHGCHSDPRKRVRVSLVRAGRALIVRIQDPGKGFAPSQALNAAISNPEGAPTRHLELRAEQGQRPGGFGILVARSMVDDLRYNQRGNEVLFVKYVK